MKKKILVIWILLLSIVGLGIGLFTLYGNKVYKDNEINYKNKNENLEKKNERLEDKTEDTGLENDDSINVSTGDQYENLEEISVSVFLEKVNHKESFIVLFSQPQCGHCIAFKPVFNQVLEENNIKAYDVNVYNLSTEDKESLYSVVKISGTPTTLIFENGEENDEYRMVGNLSEDTIRQKLKAAGYIK